MYIYAQLNADNVVEGFSRLSSEMIVENMVLINDIEVELGNRYDTVTQTFTPPEPEPTPDPQLTLEEMQMQTLLNTEYLVVMSELTNL